MPQQLSSQQALTEGDLRQMVIRLAHEIRNPLSTILSAVQLLEHLHQPEPDQIEFYQSIYTEVARINDVVRDIQRFARLDSHAATTISLAGAIGAALESETAAMAESKALVEVAGGPDVSVFMDRSQLESALSELINNAHRFSPPGSSITIRWSIRNDSQVAIDFDDQGPGVAEGNREKILRPFFSTSTQGTGLGLNIVARTCQLAGGDLEWHNLEPRGARFTMVLSILPRD
jgi:signal transduction histidine kinase